MGDLCLLTFNYDLAIDYALNFRSIPHNYGLADKPGDGIDFLKLHGSLNWRRCAKCGAIVPYFMRDFLQRFSWPPGPSDVRLTLSAHFPDAKHCNESLSSDPVIVPPTWNKGNYYSQLERVWRLAAQHLSAAEYIFIIGYSYPPTDEFFRYLFALGSIGEGWLERVYVFNPDAEVGQQIGSLLGPLAKNRYSPTTNDFVQAISVMENIRFS